MSADPPDANRSQKNDQTTVFNGLLAAGSALSCFTGRLIMEPLQPSYRVKEVMLIPFRRPQRSAKAETFDHQMRPHLAGLYRFAYRLCGHREDAEDLVQDVLIKLYRRPEDLSGLEDLGPWLHRVLYNQFVDQTRYRARRPALDQGDAQLADLAAPEDPNAAAEVSELSQRIDQALQRLSADQRALVALHLIEGHTLDHLATVLDTPVGTLKSRLHRARAQLQEQPQPAHMEPSAAGQRDTPRSAFEEAK